MAVTIEIPTEIYDAVRHEAEQAGLTAEERIERMVEITHRHRITHSLADRRAYLDRIDRGEVPGDGIPFRDLFPVNKGALRDIFCARIATILSYDAKSLRRKASEKSSICCSIA